MPFGKEAPPTGERWDVGDLFPISKARYLSMSADRQAHLREKVDAPPPASWGLENPPPGDVQTSIQGLSEEDQAAIVSGVGEIIETAFQGLGSELIEAVKQWQENADAGAGDVNEPQTTDGEIEMPKMLLTNEERKRLEDERKAGEVEVSDAEAAHILKARGPREYTMDDFNNYQNLSEQEKAEFQRQIADKTRRVMQGETF
jgi:hypothetical protein